MGEKNNIIDYISWRGDLPFTKDPVNEVDALVFSVLAYVNLEKLDWASAPTIKDLAKLQEYLDKEEGDYGPRIIADPVKKLMKLVAESTRYQDIGIRDYRCILDEATQMQFAATSFDLPDNGLFIAYRGTDESLIGWKEDLNMSFVDGIPSQMEASLFALEQIEKSDRYIILSGHSKGGNLAVWAAAYLDEDKKNRILDIYSNDAPGFSHAFLDSDEYRSVRDRIHSFVPESSIVGILLEHDDYTTIQSTNLTVFQHDPFSWSVDGRHFIYMKRRTIIGQQMDYWINIWIKALSTEEREQIVEYIWSIISSSNAKTLNDINETKIRSALSMQKAFIGMEPAKQKQMFSCLTKLVTNSITSHISLIQEKIQPD